VPEYLENIIERAVILSTGDELEVRQNLINPPNKLNLKDSSSARMEDIEGGTY